MKILRGEGGGLDTRKRGSENLYTLNPKDGGGGGGGGGGESSQKIEPLARETTKISSFEFQYLLSPPPPPLSY